MKSRTLCFNRTAFRKNITRFAPVWALYSVFLFMLMVMMAIDNDSYWLASNIADSIGPFAFVNLFYALICAQLLFGDLYNSRMCNALHAMPLRRKDWFVTNVVSGLAFSIVPNTVLAVLCLPLLENLIAVPFLWLAAVTLQYVFFFGAAVLSAYCVGNRFAMALVYIILNGFSLIAYWLIESMYAPAMYGVVIREDIFLILSPVFQMCSETSLVEVNKQNGYAFARWFVGEGWGYLGICAAIGIALMALGYLAYRKRNLECAGDFITIRWLSPIFLVLYTLCGGACCEAFFALFIGNYGYFYQILGFIIGFFTGRMLLDRTVRIFRKQTFLGFGAFLLAFSLSFLAVQIDLFGITRWIPKLERIESVRISNSNDHGDLNDSLVLTDRAQIEDVLMFHRHGIENRMEGSDGKDDAKLYITYQMKDGSQRKREYYINHDTDAGRLLKSYMSSPEAVLSDIYTQQQPVDIIRIPEIDVKVTDPAEINSLIDAVVADAKEGNMAQNWSYIKGSDYQFWLELERQQQDGLIWYCSLRIRSDARHVADWLAEHDTTAEAWTTYLEENANTK